MKYNGKNLKEVLKAHKRWASNSDPDECDRADLSEAYLFGVDLSGADLRGAILREADLRGTNLSNAKLCEADLYEACLCDANLCGADLRKTNLCKANLRGADLCKAKLYEADLHEANLYKANNIPFVPMVCPDTGSFIGWKKCSKDLIVKLYIPEDAKRCSATGRKCRCDKAIVLEIQNIDGAKADVDIAYSAYKKIMRFAYRIGETVVPEEPFDNDRWNECASGIHFFINRQEAVDYWDY